MAIKPVGMRQSAWDYLLKFTETHEGPIRHLYNAKTDEADVTLGIGISLPSETSAMASGIVALCFDPATGLPATAEQMKTDWLTASTMLIPGNQRSFNSATGELSPFAQRCLMRMTLEKVRSSVQAKLVANFTGGKAAHRDHYPDFETYPAEAQVAIVSFNYGIPAINTFPLLSIPFPTAIGILRLGSAGSIKLRRAKTEHIKFCLRTQRAWWSRIWTSTR
jgi:hypothetical protein